MLDVVKIRQLALQVGVPEDLFSGWPGEDLALYPILGGASASLEVAQRIADDNARDGHWALDLGHRAMRLSREQGTTLQRLLDNAGVPYASGSLTASCMRRAERIGSEHEAVFRELAKR